MVLIMALIKQQAIPISIIAVVIGALLSVVLQVIGAFVNDWLAGRREDRRAEREAGQQRAQWEKETEEQRAQWEREDKIRQEQQDREERRIKEDARIRAYQGFVSTASPPGKQNTASRRQQQQGLSEAYVEVQARGSQHILSEAETLYYAASDYLSDGEMDPAATERLNDARKEFWNAVAFEVDQEKTS